MQGPHCRPWLKASLPVNSDRCSEFISALKRWQKLLYISLPLNSLQMSSPLLALQHMTHLPPQCLRRQHLFPAAPGAHLCCHQQ